MQQERTIDFAGNFLSFKEVEKRTGMSRSTIYRQVKQGKFPKPRSVSDRKVGFLQVEFETWMQSRMAT